MDFNNASRQSITECKRCAPRCNVKKSPIVFFLKENNRDTFLQFSNFLDRMKEIHRQFEKKLMASFPFKKPYERLAAS